jgi:hypothetical protein
MSICFLKQKAIGSRLVFWVSTRPSRSPYCSGLLHECVLRHPLFLTSPRHTRSMLLLLLYATSLWSAYRPSLKVCWSYLIPVRSVVLQATTVPCLHFKPLDLLSRNLMFHFICAQEDFLLWIPVHPMWSHRCHVFASLQHDIVSALRIHVDRGLRDMGTRGSPPTRVTEVHVKWTRPVRSPADLQVVPETLSTIPATSGDLRLQKTCLACGTSFSPRLRRGTTSRPRIAASSLQSRKETFLICNKPRWGSTDLEWKP